MTREIETLAELETLLEQVGPEGSMDGWRLQGLHLGRHEQALEGLDPTGAAFLGCHMSRSMEERLRAAGVLVLPPLDGLPFSPYRGLLYTPDELYVGLGTDPGAGYEHTLDATVYRWSLEAGSRHDPVASLAVALHDHAVQDALDDHVRGSGLVGVMGGHQVLRGTPEYAAACALGRRLAGRGLMVATGGGPGAMEAANLGARLSGADEATVTDVLARLAGAPDPAADATAWARCAAEVAAELPEVPTLGVPTWFYGHEPPNLFATQVAKFFANARREDTLLRLCGAGIAFLPGAGGTVQELFQDACENYYAPAGQAAPMVLVDRAYWTEELPAWPLLHALAERGGFADRVHLVDSAEEADEALGG